MFTGWRFTQTTEFWNILCFGEWTSANLRDANHKIKRPFIVSFWSSALKNPVRKVVIVWVITLSFVSALSNGTFSANYTWPTIFHPEIGYTKNSRDIWGLDTTKARMVVHTPHKYDLFGIDLYTKSFFIWSAALLLPPALVWRVQLKKFVQFLNKSAAEEPSSERQA